MCVCLYSRRAGAGFLCPEKKGGGGRLGSGFLGPRGFLGLFQRTESPRAVGEGGDEAIAGPMSSGRQLWNCLGCSGKWSAGLDALKRSLLPGQRVWQF